MLYITDIHALNLPCALGTTGDWHHSAIQWDSPRTLESSESPFGDWGIEADRGIRYAGQTIEHANVANHVRACLDMIERGRLTCAQGMREDFLDGDRTFDEDIFSRVALLRFRDNWNEIDAFMKREYGMDWVDWKAEMLGDLQRKSPSRGGGPASRSDATPANQHAKHEEVASAFLAFIGQDSPLVLAGEASLIFCYGLDQFSESLDFDSTDQQAKPEEYVRVFSRANGYECSSERIGCTLKFAIRYGEPEPLEINVCSRRRRISDSEVAIVNGIKTYALESVAQMVLCAYLARNRVRDLHDVSWLVNTHWDKLSQPVRESFALALAEKGFAQFEVAIAEQADEFISKDELLQLYLRARERASVTETPDRKTHAV